MKSRINKQDTEFRQQCRKWSEIVRSAAEALGISEGEFWVWYGSPFLLTDLQDKKPAADSAKRA